MELKNFALKVKNRFLFQNVDVAFEVNTINHILGSNGIGKSCFAKACVGMLEYEGTILGNQQTVLIGSSSNIPNEFHIEDVSSALKRHFKKKEKVNKLFELLKLNAIPSKLCIKKMSDGQKQKIKLFAFLCDEPKVIIFDEFTNALDKNSSLDLYKFIREYARNYDVTVINITHNLSDLEYMPGHYFYVSNRNIKEIESKDKIIQKYIQGD